MRLKRCKLSKKQQNQLLGYFVLEVTARSAADLLGVQPNTTALYYRKTRQPIADHLAAIEHEAFAGSAELDESYFGGVRKGKRGRGAAGKVVVFGILTRQGKVYTKIVDDTRSRTLMSVIERKIAPGSIVYTDSYRSYNALDVSGFHHIGSTTRSSSVTEKIISTESRTSGARQNECCASTTASPRTHSPCS